MNFQPPGAWLTPLKKNPVYCCTTGSQQCFFASGPQYAETGLHCAKLTMTLPTYRQQTASPQLPRDIVFLPWPLVSDVEEGWRKISGQSTATWLRKTRICKYFLSSSIFDLAEAVGYAVHSYRQGAEHAIAKRQNLKEWVAKTITAVLLTNVR